MDERLGGRVRIVRPRWGDAILICGKCLKRHADSKALRRDLKAEAKAYTQTAVTRRKVRIVKVACLGLCPKRAVVIASAASLSVGEVMLVNEAGDIAAALPRLLPHSTGDGSA